VSTPDLAAPLVELLDDPIMAKLCLSLNVGSFPEGLGSSGAQHPGRFIHVTQQDLNASSTEITCGSTPRALKDIGVLIYTSGTTGKPKACSVKNFQFVLVSTLVPLDADYPHKYPNIRIFSCLPLFHGTCLFTGLCYAMGSSGTFCLGRKFSASGFSRALVESKATRMLYVGELCRYLLKAPPSPYDRSHSCIVASGNGLQRDVWEKFIDRFGIEEIREFYRSTEGIAKFDNFGKGRLGAGKVGFEGPIAHYFNTHTYLIRYNPETEEPWRDPKTGFCARAKAGEPGEAVGRVNSMDFFSDYLNNPEATSKKLISNVFQKGDLFQRTGDLLVRQNTGWVHFLDRSGDTYRWQSENVSAGEVREHISHLPDVHDVTVYGMKLEGYVCQELRIEGILMSVVVTTAKQAQLPLH
jgi:acyl-CoA synthetase (AMP-forming)/AMP-acid ligase II